MGHAIIIKLGLQVLCFIIPSKVVFKGIAFVHYFTSYHLKWSQKNKDIA